MKNKSVKIDTEADKRAEITNECVAQLDHYTATRAPKTIAQWKEDVREIVADAVNAAYAAGKKAK